MAKPTHLQDHIRVVANNNGEGEGQRGVLCVCKWHARSFEAKKGFQFFMGPSHLLTFYTFLLLLLCSFCCSFLLTLACMCALCTLMCMPHRREAKTFYAVCFFRPLCARGSQFIHTHTHTHTYKCTHVK
jgi:hypothetical protein